MAKRWLAYAVTLAVLAGIVWFVSENLGDFKPLSSIGWIDAALVLAVSGVYVVIQGALYNSVLAVFGLRLPFWESFGALILTLFGNYFFPFAGFGFRGVYLHRAHGMPARDYTIGVVAIVIVELSLYAAMGIVAMWLLLGAEAFDAWILVGFFACVVIGGLSVLFAQIPFVNRIEKLQPVVSILNSWYEFRTYKGALPKLLGFTLAQFLAYSSLFAAAFLAIDVQIPAAEAGLHAALSDFGFVFKIAPAGLGTYEALVVYTSQLAGRDVAQAMMVLLAVRFATLFWPLILAPVFLPGFTKRLQVRRLRDLLAK